MITTGRCCLTCGVAIDPERLEVLPDTRYCTSHSKAVASLVLMDYAHKTAGAIVVIPQDGPNAAEQARLAWNVYRRRR